MSQGTPAAADAASHPAAVPALSARPDRLERAYLVVLALVATTGWLALTLAELGRFSLAGLLALEGLLVAAVGALLWPRRPRGVSRPAPAADAGPRLGLHRRLEALGLGVLLLVAGWLLFRPSEYLMSGYDAGVYVMTGASIARTGGIVIADPQIASLTDAERSAAYHQTASGRFPGFYMVGTVWDGWRPRVAPLPDAVVPHALHYYPSLLAVGYALGGLDGLFLVTPVVALLGLAGFYLLARRLLGPAVAGLAATLLALNTAQSWFGRYPAAEIVVQALLFGGLLAFALALDSGRRRYALLAGFLLGAVHLTKIEALALPLALAGLLGYELLAGRLPGAPTEKRRGARGHWWLLLPYGLLWVQALGHTALISSAYALQLYGWLFAELRRLALPGGLAALAGAVLLLALRRRLAAAVRGPLAWRALTAGGVAVVALALYALYLRPYQWPWPGPASALPLAQAFVLTRNEGAVRLGWYVSEVGVLLGAGGFALALGRRTTRPLALLLAIFAVDALVLLENPRINPFHFWAARRWLPVVIPGCLLLAAYALERLWRALPPRSPERLLPLALAAGLLVFSVGALAPLATFADFRGAGDELAALAARFPEPAAVVFDADEAGLRLAAPLQYVWGRESYVAGASDAAAAVTARLVAGWLAAGRPVYWVRRAADPPAGPLGYQSELAFQQTIDLPVAEATLDRRPASVGRFRLELHAYRVVAPGPPGPR